MTIPTTIVASGPYIPNGATTVFPFGFKALSDTSVAVVLVASDGTETIVSSASYDVTLAAGDDPGGSVTMFAAPVYDGRELWIYLDPTFLQEIKFEDEGAFNQSILNQLADEAGSRNVWLRERINRAVLAPRAGAALDAAKGKFPTILLDGTIAWADGTNSSDSLRLDLVSSAGSSIIGFVQLGVGAVLRTVQNKLRDIVSVKDFGAVGDGVTDDTAAFNAALTYLSANRINGRGLGKIRVPRGRYLCNGTITIASALSLIFEGDGVEASEIIRTSDTGDLFSFAPYIYLEFADLGISHVTSSNRSTWTTNCFALSGNGGGRELCLRRVQTKNFNRVVSFSYSGNEDTNYFEGCSFNNCKTFMYGRNGQGVVNKAVQCSWFGYIDRVFDISGYGYFHIDTANVVQSGSFLYLNSAISGSASQYLVTNAKFEFWNGPNANNLLGTTKIVEMENSAANPAYLRLVNCGIAGGTPDPSVYQWDLQGSGYTVEVIGGQWGNTQVQTRARTAAGAHNAWWVAFRQLTTSPSRTINRIAGSAGAHHVPVLFNSCVGVENILLRGPGYAPGGNGRIAGIAADRNQNTKNNNGNLASGNSTTTHSFSSYGQSTLVDRIRVVATVSIGWTGAEIKAFADAALTVQIGATLTPAGGTFSTPQVFEITVPAGTFTSDGVYVTVKNTNGGGAVEGFAFVDTLSV